MLEQQIHGFKKRFFLSSGPVYMLGYDTRTFSEGTDLCTIHYIWWGIVLISRGEKNLVSFSNKNTPTKCFLLKYWWRRTSGLNSSIQGTHSSATTTRKHWIPFYKVRTRHITLIKHEVSNSSTHFSQNSIFLLIYEWYHPVSQTN